MSSGNKKDSKREKAMKKRITTKTQKNNLCPSFMAGQDWGSRPSAHSDKTHCRGKKHEKNPGIS